VGATLHLWVEPAFDSHINGFGCRFYFKSDVEKRPNNDFHPS
jgi:hypothetical protein